MANTISTTLSHATPTTPYVPQVHRECAADVDVRSHVLLVHTAMVARCTPMQRTHILGSRSTKRANRETRTTIDQAVNFHSPYHSPGANVSLYVALMSVIGWGIFFFPMVTEGIGEQRPGSQKKLLQPSLHHTKIDTVVGAQPNKQAREDHWPSPPLAASVG